MRSSALSLFWHIWQSPLPRAQVQGMTPPELAHLTPSAKERHTGSRLIVTTPYLIQSCHPLSMRYCIIFLAVSNCQSIHFRRPNRLSWPESWRNSSSDNCLFFCLQFQCFIWSDQGEDDASLQHVLTLRHFLYPQRRSQEQRPYPVLDLWGRIWFKAGFLSNRCCAFVIENFYAGIFLSAKNTHRCVPLTTFRYDRRHWPFEKACRFE